jgi:hypothetical protein
LEAAAQFVVACLCIFAWGSSIVGVLALLAQGFMEMLR